VQPIAAVLAVTVLVGFWRGRLSASLASSQPGDQVLELALPLATNADFRMRRDKPA
jgi:hypothetical protein